VAREQIVETVNHLVPAIPVGDLETLAHQAVPLATDPTFRTSPAEYPRITCGPRDQPL
jgi:hypothetical protein